MLGKHKVFYPIIGINKRHPSWRDVKADSLRRSIKEPIPQLSNEQLVQFCVDDLTFWCKMIRAAQLGLLLDCRKARMTMLYRQVYRCKRIIRSAGCTLRMDLENDEWYCMTKGGKAIYSRCGARMQPVIVYTWPVTGDYVANEEMNNQTGG